MQISKYIFFSYHNPLHVDRYFFLHLTLPLCHFTLDTLPQSTKQAHFPLTYVNVPFTVHIFTVFNLPSFNTFLRK
jgi:hypothetical protein